MTADGGNRLLGSLDALSLRASLLALAIPLLVAALWFVADGRTTHRAEIPKPLLAVELASDVLEPMFAGVGLLTAVVVLAARLFVRPVNFPRSAAQVVAGAWAGATALVYVLAVLPAITG